MNVMAGLRGAREALAAERAKRGGNPLSWADVGFVLGLYAIGAALLALFLGLVLVMSYPVVDGLARLDNALGIGVLEPRGKVLRRRLSYPWEDDHRHRALFCIGRAGCFTTGLKEDDLLERMAWYEERLEAPPCKPPLRCSTFTVHEMQEFAKLRAQAEEFDATMYRHRPPPRLRPSWSPND